MSEPEILECRAIDGQHVRAELLRPSGRVRGALVVIQEVFGVNRHIRRVAARFAEAGWLSAAPRLYDRIAPGLELDYDAAGVARGREAVAQLGWDAPLRDVRAAAEGMRGMLDGGTVAVVGYCWGGTLACLCATRLGLPAVGYYGARSAPFLHERPQAPMLLHFGREDPLFPLTEVERLRRAWPHAEIHLYPAGHGFNCDERPDFHADSAALALSRSQAFLDALPTS